MFTHHPDTSTQNRAHDLAKAEAVRLRSAAMQHFADEVADDFWRGADAVWQRSLQTGQAVVERSAARLNARLARHQRERNASGAPAGPCAGGGLADT
jgi:hypothetical protein